MAHLGAQDEFFFFLMQRKYRVDLRTHESLSELQLCTSVKSSSVAVQLYAFRGGATRASNGRVPVLMYLFIDDRRNLHRRYQQYLYSRD